MGAFMKKLLIALVFISSLFAYEQPNFEQDCAQLQQQWNIRFYELNRGVNLVANAIEGRGINEIERLLYQVNQWGNELAIFINEQATDECTRTFAMGLYLKLSIHKKKIEEALAVHQQLTK